MPRRGAINGGHLRMRFGSDPMSIRLPNMEAQKRLIRIIVRCTQYNYIHRYNCLSFNNTH